MIAKLLAGALLALLALAPAARADHIPGRPCEGCASHKYWPSIDGLILKARDSSEVFVGTPRNDELLGHHGSDVLRGKGGRDVLWGDWDPKNQPKRQRDRIYGGPGTDFIYGSHGRNRIYGGKGNDVISVHFGRGVVDCGPGRDIYHVVRHKRHRWKFRRCEKVEYRSESQRGGPMKPLRG